MTQSAQRYPHDFRPGVPHFPASLRAFEIQRQSAIAHGQVWTEHHANVFKELQQSYVLTGLGMTLGRKAWPLAVGTGKTQSIIALLKAQSEQIEAGQRVLSVLVCVEQVRQIEALHNDAVAAGVPAHFMGMYHAESPLPDAEQRPFLFATHSRMLRGALSIAAVNTFNGAPRSLVIWDESLIHSRPQALDIKDADAAIYRLRIEATEVETKDTRDAVGFLEGYCEALKAETKGKPTMTHAELTPEDETRFVLAIKSTLSGERLKSEREHVLTLIESCNRPSRVATYSDAGKRRGAVQYTTLVPDSLKRLIVLDASHTVRLLCSRHDRTVTTVNFDCNVKRFDNVTVKQFKQGAGRGTLEKELPKGLKSPLIKALVTEIESYPVTEPVLIVNFKQDVKLSGRKGKASHQDLLKDAMHAAGLNTESDQYRFITWGMHIGANDYRDCKHVVCVGVLRRNPLDVVASIISQEQNLETSSVDNPDTLKEVELSEMFHHLMQCAGRGSCRQTTAGQAHSMSLAFVCPDTFPDHFWQDSMPGVELVTEARKGKLSDPVQAILKALDGLPSSNQRISSKTLKALAGLDAMKPNRFSEALKVACKGLSGWEYVKENQGFARLSDFAMMFAAK